MYDDGDENYDENLKLEVFLKGAQHTEIVDKLSVYNQKERLELLSEYGKYVGFGVGIPYEALYVLSPDSQKDVLDAEGNLELDKFDQAGWKVVENTEEYKEVIEVAKKKVLDKALEQLC